jgi:hypothetical protein
MSHMLLLWQREHSDQSSLSLCSRNIASNALLRTFDTTSG